MLVTFALLLQVAVLPTDSATIAAVRAQAEREPVEAFGKLPGTVAVREIVFLDMNGDGFPEAFVSIEPKFRQTPTIIVYSFDAHGMHRLIEGLVPGSLLPISGKYQDDHTLGFGMDLTVGGGDSPEKADGLVKSASSSGMSLVRYQTFYHSDMRKGFMFYVDLGARPLPSPSTNGCGDFEFGVVEALAAGTLSGSPNGKYLVALTSSNITIYRFRGLHSNGTLDKQVWILARPAGATGLNVTPGGDVEVQMGNGSTAQLATP